MNAYHPFRAASELPPLHPSLAKLDPDPDEDTYAAALAALPRRKMRGHLGGRPSVRHEQIMSLMADGRERTVDDICRVIAMDRNNAQVQLSTMVCGEFLTSERLFDVTVYRLPGAAP